MPKTQTLPLARRVTCLRISTLIGGLLLCLPDTGLWSWGNMSSYVLSYMRLQGLGRQQLESPWLISLVLIANSLGITTAGALCRYLGRRWTLVIGILLFDGGLLLSYWTVQSSSSMAGLNLTNGVMAGLGFGFLYGMVALYVVDWAHGNEGVLLAVIGTFSTVGGAVTIQMTSFFINPANLTPDLQLGPKVYFTQLSLLDRVPSVYILLGVFSLVFHAVGLALLRDKPDTGQVQEGKSDETNLPSTENSSLQQHNASLTKYSEDNHLPNNVSKSDTAEHIKGQVPSEESRRTTDCLDNGISQPDTASSPNTAGVFHLTNDDRNTGTCKEEVEEKEGGRNPKNNRKLDYSPWEMVQDRIFYLLWVVLIFNDLGYIVFANYYKSLGQLFISNDHSLANVGTAITVGVAVTRVLWGMMIDRLGVKWVMVIFSSAFAVLFSFYYFTPMLTPWLYYAWSVVLGCVDSALQANFSIAALKYFGQKHFAFNMGLIMSSTVFINLVAPPLLRILLDQWGWFALFFTTALTNFLSLLIVTLGLPHT